MCLVSLLSLYLQSRSTKCARAAQTRNRPPPILLRIFNSLEPRRATGYEPSQSLTLERGELWENFFTPRLAGDSLNRLLLLSSPYSFLPKTVRFSSTSSQVKAALSYEIHTFLTIPPVVHDFIYNGSVLTLSQRLLVSFSGLFHHASAAYTVHKAANRCTVGFKKIASTDVRSQ